MRGRATGEAHAKALEELRKGMNTNLYQEVRPRSALPNQMRRRIHASPLGDVTRSHAHWRHCFCIVHTQVMAKTGGAPDKAWIASVEKHAQAARERLEAEMNTYRTNLIKDSIRARHYSTPPQPLAPSNITTTITTPSPSHPARALVMCASTRAGSLSRDQPRAFSCRVRIFKVQICTVLVVCRADRVQ